MTQIKLAKQLEKNFKQAMSELAAFGFIYDYKEETRNESWILYTIDAEGQQLFNIGYNIRTRLQGKQKEAEQSK